MRPASSIDDLFEAPIGAYLVGRSWIYFGARPDLFGFLLWGTPTLEDVRSLCRALEVELGDGVGPHASMVDVSRVEVVDAEAFAAFHRYVQDHAQALRARVERLVLVRPDGLAGAVAAGFYETLQSPYPVEVFADARAALASLDLVDLDPLLDELSGLYAAIAGVGPTTGAVRGAVAGRLDDADVHAIARVLGLSSRTLQRRLQEEGTSFQQVLTETRIREAQRLLLASSAPISRIAIDAGFGSVQHFSTRFREVVGMSPSEWRAARR